MAWHVYPCATKGHMLIDLAQQIHRIRLNTTLINTLITAFNDQIFYREEVKTMGDDMLMMKNGHMLILKNSEMIALSEDMVLSDGTRIALDGRVIMVDGTFETLVEGQAILVESTL